MHRKRLRGIRRMAIGRSFTCGATHSEPRFAPRTQWKAADRSRLLRLLTLSVHDNNDCRRDKQRHSPPLLFCFEAVPQSLPVIGTSPDQPATTEQPRHADLSAQVVTGIWLFHSINLGKLCGHQKWKTSPIMTSGGDIH